MSRLQDRLSELQEAIAEELATRQQLRVRCSALLVLLLCHGFPTKRCTRRQAPFAMQSLNLLAVALHGMTLQSA